MSPKTAKYYSNRAICYGWESNYDRALTDLTQAIELEPRNPKWYTERSHIYKLRNEDQIAASDLERVKKSTTPKEVLEQEEKQAEAELEELKQTLLEAMVLQEKGRAQLESIKADIAKVDLNAVFTSREAMAPTRERLVGELDQVVARMTYRYENIIVPGFARLKDRPHDIVMLQKKALELNDKTEDPEDGGKSDGAPKRQISKGRVRGRRR